jgi:hypothetical protein
MASLNFRVKVKEKELDRISKLQDTKVDCLVTPSKSLSSPVFPCSLKGKRSEGENDTGNLMCVSESVCVTICVSKENNKETRITDRRQEVVNHNCGLIV